MLGMKNTIAVVGAGLALLVMEASARVWTEEESGRTIEAELVRVAGESVVLRRAGGREVTVPLATLSAADREFVAGQASSDWPSWQGPNRDNRSPDTGLLKEWPEGGPKLLWTFDKAGAGYSSPSITGGKIYFTGTRDGEAELICLEEESGEEIWSAPIGDDAGQGYNAGWGDGPRGAPTVSDGRVYAMTANGDVACMAIDGGKVLWRKSLVDDFGGKVPGWGYAESPLVDGDKLIVTPGGNDGAIVALDKASGEEIWRSKELTDEAQYSSVIVAEAGGKRQYVQLFMKKLAGVDAENGDLLWTSDWRQGRTAVIPTPIFHDGHVYITAGYGAGSKKVKIGADSAEDVWENKVMKNHHGGVVLVDGHLYGFSDGPGFLCQSWGTGERVWSEKGDGLQKGAVHYADGMLYGLDEHDGSVFLAEATPKEFREKGRFQLPKKTKLRDDNRGMVWTHPVVIGGRLYLRDQDHLFCYDVKG